MCIVVVLHSGFIYNTVYHAVIHQETVGSDSAIAQVGMITGIIIVIASAVIVGINQCSVIVISSVSVATIISAAGFVIAI